MGKGEAWRKGEAEAEQVADSADHEKWGKKWGQSQQEEKQLLKGEAWEKEKQGKRRSRGKIRSRG